MVDRRSTDRTGAASPDDASGTETILLVEDDHDLRRTVHRQLTARGYQVLDAAGGDEALAICGQQAGAIHLVLTDMVMPRRTGPEVAQLVQEQRPAAKVLFMSGYSDHPLLEHGPSSQVNFIQKPFAARALAAKVRGVLDSPAPVAAVSADP